MKIVAGWTRTSWKIAIKNSYVDCAK